MLTAADVRVLVAARITGLLILAFAAVQLIGHLALAWVGAVFDGDIELGSKHADEALQVLAPTFSASWVVGCLAWGTGMFLLARARGPARPAAIVTATLAAIATVAAARYVTLSAGPLDAGIYERLDTLAIVASASSVLMLIAAMVVLMLLARGRAHARPLFILGCVAALSPAMTALRFVAYESPMPWAAYLGLAGDAALGIGFVWASAGVDDRTLDHASARALELARALLWVRVGLVVASVMSSVFGAPPRTNHQPFLSSAAWLGHLEAVAGVGFALAVMLIGLRHRARERLLGAAGGCILFVLSLVGVGLSLAQREAMLQPDSYFDHALLDHVQLVQAIDPYLRGLSVVAMLLCVITWTRIADPGWIRDDIRLRAIRFMTIVVLASLVWIVAREDIARLGKGVWAVAVFALVAAIMALIDVTKLLRCTAQALRGELPDAAEPDSDEPGAPAW